MAAPVTNYGVVGDALASVPKNVDSAQPQAGAPIKLASRGEQIVQNVWNGMQQASVEGSYFLAATATPGTGIVLSVATGTTFSDTQAMIVLNNNDSVGAQGKLIILDFISFIVTTAPTNQTIGYLAHRIDSAVRGTSGTQLGAVGTSPRQSNMAYSGSAVGQAYALGASAVQVAASANVRNVGRNMYRGQIPVVGDHITIKFGSAEMAAGGVNIAATTASAITIFAPPVSIGPQQSYVLNEWATGRSAALSGEVVMGWIER